jgi:hypothetical protein
MKNKITASLICLLIVGVCAATAYKPHQLQRDKPQVVNKTQLFQVVSLDFNAKGDAYLLTLINGYSKNINGYSLGIGSARLDVDLTRAERVIAPGETIRESIPASNLQSANANQTLNPINILSVMFEDGGSDGDPDAITNVRQRRLGTKLQLQRITAILETALAAPGNITIQTLDDLKSQVSNLPVEPSTGQSPIVKSGLKSAKEDTLLEIESLKQNRNGLQEGLQKIKVKVGRRAGSL